MYSVYPLMAEVRPWLDEQSVSYPPDVEGRNPTLLEIRAALALLLGYSVKETTAEIGKFWQAFIESADSPETKGWAILNILDLAEGPNEFYFEKGFPDLIVAITVLVANYTGPLLLICDAGDPPLVITPGADARELFESWGTTPN